MESRTKKSCNLNIPTLLTILRILLVIPVVVCIFMDSLPAQIITIVCFVVASVTDFIDGKLARNTGQVTNLGKFLDPLADKILVNLTFLALVVLSYVPIWMFGVILVRDFAVDGLRMMAATKQVTIAASKYGKLKTLVQMITITLILLNIIVGSNIFTVINEVLLYMVVFLTVLSGANYLIKGRRLVL